MWTKNHKECVKCKRTNIPHKAHGLCKTCYEASKGYKWQKDYHLKHKDEIKAKRKTLRKIWFERIIKKDGMKCRECGTEKNLTLQHKIPKCIGGEYSYNNLEILCYKCNRNHWNELVKKSLNLYFQEKG